MHIPIISFHHISSILIIPYSLFLFPFLLIPIPTLLFLLLSYNPLNILPLSSYICLFLFLFHSFFHYLSYLYSSYHISHSYHLQYSSLTPILYIISYTLLHYFPSSSQYF